MLEDDRLPIPRELVRAIAQVSAEFTLYVWFAEGDDRLRVSLRGLVRELRAQRLPPERILVTLKLAMPWELLSAPRKGERRTPHRDARAALDSAVSWCIRDFFSTA